MTEHKTVGIFDRQYRAMTIGIMLVLTTSAFEGLAITTIAAKIAQDMQGLHLYGWIFSAFLLSQLVGTLVMGQQVDKQGVFNSMLVSFTVFVLGTIIAAASLNMYMLIGGRAFQGFGAGALITCVYACVTLYYPDSLRTQILAAFSMAFVLPSLIGPYFAGLIASYISWRFVFWIVIPLIAIALLLTYRSFRDLQRSQQVTGGARAIDSRTGQAILLAIGTGLLLTGLGMITNWQGIALSMGGLMIMIPLMHKLLPQGTFLVQAGLPATLVTRGLYVACYFATESFVILGLTELKGLSADTAGLLVAAGSLSWSGAAWLQARLDAKDRGEGRKRRVMLGIGTMIGGVMLVILALFLQDTGIMLILISQIIIGFGVGLANPTTAVIALQYAELGHEGKMSANLQFVDSFYVAMSIGVSGALVALAETMRWGISTGIFMVLMLQLLLVLLSFLSSLRISILARHKHSSAGQKIDTLPM
ncbi:MFS transporter [Paenibacillus barcinonensis]|uniref:MFS transporter n=2 Tax=Paenibacillus barcinonensis TaxID=198119 RepID=A0A2V4V897_PAEBA|nr:MFS transporter [Paenibacillus barcinonensis]PYE48069.1 MFS transporter [Paenibacillus barcinonensis]